MLFPYLLDAAEIFQSGVNAEEIDGALVEWGMPMGPLRLIDEIGVDITVDIAETLEKAYGERDRAPEILQKMREAEIARPQNRQRILQIRRQAQSPNETIAGMAPANRAKICASGETISPTGWSYLMVNEAARCLEEKVVATPEDADYGMVLGTGFPPFRGGPLRFAESVGLKKVVTSMDGSIRAPARNSRHAICFVSTPERNTFYEGSVDR